MKFLPHAFAVGVESLFYLTNRQTCSLHTDPDLFNGRSYSLESFVNFSTPYLDHPEEFFTTDVGLDAVCVREGRHPNASRPSPRDYVEMLMDSPAVTPWRENNSVPFKWFRTEQANTVLLFVPGWGRRSQTFEEDMSRRFRRHGVDVALLTVPFHQARTPAGSFSGEYFISANLLLTVENFRAFVAEIRLITEHLRRSYKRVGILGMSSGGFHAGLASLCESFDYFFPVVTGCNLGKIVWHGLNTQHMRRDLERRGITEREFSRVWKIIDLAALGHHCRARSVKHYIARYDRVIPVKHQLALWRALGKWPRMVLSASHYSSYFYRHSVVDDIVGTIAMSDEGPPARLLLAPHSRETVIS
ncbi:MAG TPA: hypothetical protein VE974_01030 [Thermoanaerobaculia bacterium]|nr:hypothetical protein [Thermoanaerobaculia bacterium]